MTNKEAIDILNYELPERIEEAAETLQMHIRTFRATVQAYVLAHKDTYIDKEGYEQ